MYRIFFFLNKNKNATVHNAIGFKWKTASTCFKKIKINVPKIINLESDQHTPKTQMGRPSTKLTPAHASAFVFIAIYMLRNKQCHKDSLCTMMSQVVLVAYRIILNISRRKGVTKLLPKKLHCHVNRSLNSIKSPFDKISLHGHFKPDIIGTSSIFFHAWMWVKCSHA